MIEVNDRDPLTGYQNQKHWKENHRLVSKQCSQLYLIDHIKKDNTSGPNRVNLRTERLVLKNRGGTWVSRIFNS